MRMTTAAGVAGGMIAACACALPAVAGPPFNVDDPGTTETRHYEINLTYLSSQVRGSEAEGPYLEVNYGYKNNVELTLGGGLSSIRNTGTDRATGFGDVYPEIGWRFREESKSAPALAVHYIGKIPTARTSNGLGTGRADHTVEFIAGKSLKRYSLFGNAGYTVLGDSRLRNNAFYGAGLSYQATEKLVIGADVYGNTSAAPGVVDELAYDAAATYDIMPNRTLLLSVGRSVHGLSDLNVTAGIQFVFGPKPAEKGDAKEADVGAAGPKGADGGDKK